MKTLFIEKIIKKEGKEVELFGWAETIRDHKKIVFIDLRDRTGIVQIVGGSELRAVTSEDVLYVKGTVKPRPKNLVNPKIPTGEVEIKLKEYKILSKSKTLPFPIEGDGYDIDEEIRLKYRFLDLRRKRMLKNLLIRFKILGFVREFLTKNDFIEVETPILTKTTPEGARDFVVPSRLQKGKFYALPQSPQQYKQMLMASGLERYFQIARCFRDEDPRADRAYGEFTQLDIEMSFVSQEDILKITEELFSRLIAKIFPNKKIYKTPWPRISHSDAIKKYNTDKPDIRGDKKDKDALAFCWILDYPLFTQQTEDDYYHGIGKATLAPSHHMFTAPHPDDIGLLESAPEKVRGLQHDLVLNGFEIGGGSIRIHDQNIQKKIFKIIGFKEKDKQSFEHLLEAFQYGTPPHGGIAPGIDRFLMVVLGEPSVREVIPFPMTSGGKTAIMDAPSELSREQLDELGIVINASKK